MAETMKDEESQVDEGVCVSFSNLKYNVKKNIRLLVVNSGARKEWRSLGRELDIDVPDLDTIADDYKGDQKEQCERMLEAWIQKKAGDATVQVLTTALINIGQRDVADAIMELDLRKDLT